MALKILILVVVLFTGVSIVGLLLKNPRTTTMTVEIKASIANVWSHIVSAEKQTTWRSDIKDVILNSSGSELKEFTEVPKSGPSITFKETAKKPNYHYRIDIVPKVGFAGYSTIDLKEKDQTTVVEFVEVSNVSNPYRRILSYIFYNPEARMKVYIDDLRAAVAR